jgi:glucose/arabinose dehydrogenase
VSCSETFTNVGTFPYHCNFHQFFGMVGTVIVTEAITNTPAPDTNRIVDPIPAKIPKGNVRIELQPVADGLVAPIGAATPDDGSGRLFVYDQIGLVYVMENDRLLPTPLLDVRDRLLPIDPGYDERGLIGLAVHTNFAQFPFIYTCTSEPKGPFADFPIETPIGSINDHQQVIAEWRIDAADSNGVDSASRREILRLDKPDFNHNGGTMRFGPDGFLYFGVGDGGAADDQGRGHPPGGNGQDKTRILGKIARIDVDARTSANGQYGVPATILLSISRVLSPKFMRMGSGIPSASASTSRPANFTWAMSDKTMSRKSTRSLKGAISAGQSKKADSFSTPMVLMLASLPVCLCETSHRT